ncbi:hypothetical protein D8674_018800 [Pyrus ussuriensis x Pyrus communis]|uniref:DUF7894 domain-containing protein n=1 Tax=Pyrus ussuriensis x Pyrus communis TaxID=2448454 RepID=A0A5N5G6A4_9ROSA|nr:hypothetical protein D8674_018800 [Pyrus ussuriensis x Pyrus communis]
MKVGSKVVFLLRYSEGFGEAISAAFGPSPSNYTVEESFELSLELYGIQNCKASGILRHFLDPQGQYEVPVLLMEYEPPILACGIIEIHPQFLQSLPPRLWQPKPRSHRHHEHLACFLQLVRILKLPIYVLIGQRGHISDKEEFQILYEIGELLASTLNLSFSRDKITWNPTRKSKDDREPWCALYG